MTKLIVPLSVVAAATAVGAVLLMRTNRKRSRWSVARSSVASWSKTAGQGAGKAAHKVAGRA
jgi:hypothetical protein